MGNKERIYLDYAATTPLLPEALEAMLPYLQGDFGNPSSLYGRGVVVRKAVEKARQAISACIGAKPEEVFFTSGGTESDNWALEGVARALRSQGKHIIVSSIEHHAILNCCQAMKKYGYEITYLPVTATGRVEVADLAAALRPDTVLVSIMLANNEIGTIQDISALAKIAHKHGALFHTDAVQAVGHIPVNVKRLGVDLLSASAHKFNGPQGCGFLYVKAGTAIAPFHLGGQQEYGMRAGTENVAAIVGMATALERHISNLDFEQRKLRSFAKRFQELITRKKKEVVFNGDIQKRLPGHISVSFPGYDGEALLHLLDLKGVCVSTGAACNSKNTEISHVLKAIGLQEDSARGTLRITFGEENTLQELISAGEILLSVLAKFSERGHKE